MYISKFYLFPSYTNHILLKSVPIKSLREYFVSSNKIEIEFSLFQLHKRLAWNAVLGDVPWKPRPVERMALPDVPRGILFPTLNTV